MSQLTWFSRKMHTQISDNAKMYISQLNLSTTTNCSVFKLKGYFFLQNYIMTSLHYCKLVIVSIVQYYKINVIFTGRTYTEIEIYRK